MRTEMVRIAAPSGQPLDGLLHSPEGEAKGAALYFHGNQMNFYTGGARFLAEPLTSAGYALLAFNRRGHDTISTFESREPMGGAFQTSQEGAEDNESAAAFLAERGFDQPIVIGHSNGGMLGGDFVARHAETRALVLLSAHRGGDLQIEASRRGLFAGDRLEELTERAHELIAAGKPRELMLMPGWWWAISAQTFIDTLTTLPKLVDNARKISCPVLFVRGDEEPEAVYPAQAFQAACAGPCDVEIIENCGHFYVGAEERVARVVVDWLSRNVG